MRLGKRRQEIRKLARQARERSKPGAEAPPVTPPPKPAIPVSEDELARESTLFEASRVVEVPSPAPAQDDTEEELLALPSKDADNSETEVGLRLEPDPPERLLFPCPCGAPMVATKKDYDQKVRCPKCQTLMLASLLADPSTGTFAIEPLRVGRLPDLS
jgi:hypothetical protein